MSAGRVLDDRVPGREWSWNHGPWGHDGVHTHQGTLEWFAARPDDPDGGGATAQTYESFLQDGPRHPAPADVLEDLQTLLRTARTG
ncbi:MAG: hypothetical protein ACI9WU_004878 [Myxococcota bacterium]|jgi:hypothetical protein